MVRIQTTFLYQKKGNSFAAYPVHTHNLKTPQNSDTIVVIGKRSTYIGQYKETTGSS